MKKQMTPEVCAIQYLMYREKLHKMLTLLAVGIIIGLIFAYAVDSMLEGDAIYQSMRGEYGTVYPIALGLQLGIGFAGIMCGWTLIPVTVYTFYALIAKAVFSIFLGTIVMPFAIIYYLIQTHRYKKLSLIQEE